MRAQSDLLAARLARARHVVIPRAGHFAHFEQPEAVAHAIDAFLAELA
jgi:pimeloyl-ACP methyl ester carboxylesterase